MKRIKECLIIIFIFLFFLFLDNIYSLRYSDTLTCNIIQDDNSNRLNQLENILGIAENNNYNYLLSKVTYRNIYNFSQNLTINKGSKNNIENNMPVINNQGLIGIIKKSYNNKAIVQLLTNKNTEISVRINNSYGILKADNNDIYVSNITNKELINIGDKIYTSGIGKLPGDILIGYVNNIIIKNPEIEQILEITPAVNFNDVYYVMVIIS